MAIVGPPDAGYLSDDQRDVYPHYALEQKGTNTNAGNAVCESVSRRPTRSREPCARPERKPALESGATMAKNGKLRALVFVEQAWYDDSLRLLVGGSKSTERFRLDVNPVG